jgi:signal transduction histidine kinase
VTDNGIGLKNEDLERIFLRFEQAQNPRTGMHQGAGLGLFLARNLVTLHRGIIWAESQGLGKGTTVQFLIPLLPEGKEPGER